MLEGSPSAGCCVMQDVVLLSECHQKVTGRLDGVRQPVEPLPSWKWLDGSACMMLVATSMLDVKGNCRREALPGKRGGRLVAHTAEYALPKHWFPRSLHTTIDHGTTKRHASVTPSQSALLPHHQETPPQPEQQWLHQEPLAVSDRTSLAAFLHCNLFWI